MGVIYKLRPEIKEFILGQKRENPILSCRRLTLLVENKFQIKLSKSSINSIIKEAGLSVAVGRTAKKPRPKQEIPTQLIEFKPEKPLEIKAEVPAEAAVEQPAIVSIKEEAAVRPEFPSETLCTGAILLKAADGLIRGSFNISEAIKTKLNRAQNDLLAKTESLLYLPLFEKEISGLCSLVAREFSLEDILSYLNELQSVTTLTSDIFQIISHTLQEVRCIKISCLNGNVFYLDGQMHTIWSTPYLPYDFSATLYKAKSYINKYFFEDGPFILFTAPEYDIPTKEFFNFILSLDTKERTIARLTLYGNKLEELENIPVESAKRRFFVFGFWPWQFVEYRRINKIGEFKPFFVQALQKDFYIAEIEIELSQPIEKQSVTLKGCALKTTPTEKTRLVILSNLPSQVFNLEELANIYLSHWPNIDECFQDFSRKIELFTYTATSQRFFSAQVFLNRENERDIKLLFGSYLKALDLYVRWHFLPSSYKDSDFPTINERFYSLKVRLKREKDRLLATFQTPSGFPFLKELEYACCRINENEIIDSEQRRLQLDIAP